MNEINLEYKEKYIKYKKKYLSLKEEVGGGPFSRKTKKSEKSEECDQFENEEACNKGKGKYKYGFIKQSKSCIWIPKYGREEKKGCVRATKENTEKFKQIKRKREVFEELEKRNKMEYVEVMKFLLTLKMTNKFANGEEIKINNIKFEMKDLLNLETPNVPALLEREDKGEDKIKDMLYSSYKEKLNTPRSTELEDYKIYKQVLNFVTYGYKRQWETPRFREYWDDNLKKLWFEHKKIYFKLTNEEKKNLETDELEKYENNKKKAEAIIEAAQEVHKERNNVRRDRMIVRVG